VQFYRLSGLLVQSEVALPGAVPVTADGAPEVTIRYGQVAEELPNATASAPTWQMAGKQFLLHIPNVARFLLTAGCDIAVEPASDASKADVPIFLLGTVFGLLQHQRGRIVLHASAVSVNGQAVLFCGRTGAGKSTLAAALAQRGYPLISDDICAISTADHLRPAVHADGRKLKLWTRDIERLGLAERRGPRVRRAIDKCYVEFGSGVAEPLTIAAIYSLQEALPPVTPGIKRPNAVDAALILRRHSYRQLMVQRLGQWPLYFKAGVAIGNSVPLFNLYRTRDLAKFPELVASLEQHWAEMRLAEKAA
jgi:hypothetical protein